MKEAEDQSKDKLSKSKFRNLFKAPIRFGNAKITLKRQQVPPRQSRESPRVVQEHRVLPTFHNMLRQFASFYINY